MASKRRKGPEPEARGQRTKRQKVDGTAVSEHNTAEGRRATTRSRAFAGHGPLSLTTDRGSNEAREDTQVLEDERLVSEQAIVYETAARSSTESGCQSHRSTRDAHTYVDLDGSRNQACAAGKVIW